MERRDFLKSAAAAGAGVLLADEQFAPAQAGEPAEALNVAIIGAGTQGRALIDAAVRIPQVRFCAVCDIWEYNRNYAQKYVKQYGHEPNGYADYREMLQKQQDLHAVLVATPDFLHAEHANACLKAGLHVYCETIMAETLEKARSMVRTMRQTGKLLQIGYQRRSNSRYRHACEKLLREARLPGQLMNVHAQWVFGVGDERGWPKKQTMTEEELRQAGYGNMHEFRNWLFYKKFGAGPCSNLAAHQVDVVNWFLGSVPKTVLAGGGCDYYKKRQGLDNVLAICEYDTPEGTVRALFEVLTTTSAGGSGIFEHFLGVEGSIKISANPKWTKIYREPDAPEWEKWIRKNYVSGPEKPKEKPPGHRGEAVVGGEKVVEETGLVEPYDLPVLLGDPLPQPHLENFLDAIRGKAQLAAAGDEAFRTEVLVRKIAEAVEAKRMLTLTPADFAV